jgi:HEAT repeats
MSQQTHDDLAERVGLEPLPSAPVARFDQRSDSELRECAVDHESPMERERALWELAYRGENMDLILDRVGNDPDPAVRWNLLWLLAKSGTEHLGAALSGAATDDAPEVRDWSSLFAEEQIDTPPQLAYREAVYTAGGSFDQTVPLEIAGFADVFVPDGGWVRAHLSPMWFNHIMGRVMAAINVDTFMTDLVIEKELRDYNPDGSHHYEPFFFRGASIALTPLIVQHIYEATGPRQFYPSGRLKEADPIDVHVTLARAAVTERITGEQIDIVSQDNESARGDALRSFGIVRSVRGRFSGWAYTDLERFAASGSVEPGTVQLTSPTDPAGGERTNTLLHGTFRGKLADHDHDGRYDINTIPCHATLTGELDLDCDGQRDSDPYISVGLTV